MTRANSWTPYDRLHKDAPPFYQLPKRIQIGNDICKNFNIFWPPLPCPHLEKNCSIKFTQPPCYICITITPLWCGHHIWTLSYKITEVEKIMGVGPTMHRWMRTLKKLAILRREVLLCNHRDKILRWTTVINIIVAWLFTCCEADRSSRGRFICFLSFFLTKFKKRSKTGLNCQNKNGSIWSLKPKFQIWGRFDLRGRLEAKIKFFRSVSAWWKFLSSSPQRTNFSKIPQKIFKNLQEWLQKSKKSNSPFPSASVAGLLGPNLVLIVLWHFEAESYWRWRAYCVLIFADVFLVR